MSNNLCTCALIVLSRTLLSSSERVVGNASRSRGTSTWKWKPPRYIVGFSYAGRPLFVASTGIRISCIGARRIDNLFTISSARARTRTRVLRRTRPSHTRCFETVRKTVAFYEEGRIRLICVFNL